jgi:shikimate kinase
VNTNRRNPGAVVRYIASRLENPEPRRRRPPWRRPAAAAPAPEHTSGTPGPAASSPADSGPVTPATLARRAGVRK